MKSNFKCLIIKFLCTFVVSVYYPFNSTTCGFYFICAESIICGGFPGEVAGMEEVFLTGKGSTYDIKAGFIGACGRRYFCLETARMKFEDVFNVDRARI